MKKLLSERFKELAGIKPLYEQRSQGAPVDQRTEEYVEFYDLEELQDRLEQVYREMEQEAEPEGGPIADEYGAEIEAIEKAIQIKKGKNTDQSNYGRFDPGPSEPTYGDAVGQNPEYMEYEIKILSIQEKNEVMKFLEDDLTRDLKHFGVKVSVNDEDWGDDTQSIFVHFSQEDDTQIHSRIQKLIKSAVEDFIGHELGHEVELLPERNFLKKRNK